ncbi:hypothetical protein EPO05_05775 [Patescibacteria group bacterium]|nr:MAG: hypothetical protein EPO05_05775 [Patescibacteria group bacterium]
MDPMRTWGEAIYQSLYELWVRFVGFVPSFIGAILVFIAGMVVAVALGKAVEKLVAMLRVDRAFDKMNAGDQLKEAGVKIELSKILGGLVKWFLILVFLMAAVDILQLTQVTVFLNRIILYMPNVIVATLVLSIAFIVGNFVFKIVRSSTKVAGVARAEVVAAIAKWAIFLFGILAALVQLEIAAPLVNNLALGVVFAVSLALGLAFGLGGRDEAALLLRKIREDLSEK